MKKKFISVAMFLALAVSSPVWVGCADYDDDIANLQSQVDGLKQSVEVSTAEAISALQSAQNELQADIEDLTTSTGVTSSDVETLKSQIEAMQAALDANDINEAGQLAAEVQDLISKINEEVSPELEQLQKDLETQKTDLEGQINDLNQKLTELEGDLQNAATEEDITALQGQINEINTKLGDINDDYVDVSNRLDDVEDWVDTNGTELAKLTSKVSQIESLLTYLDAEKQANIDKITAPEVLADIMALETMNTDITNLQLQIGNATTEGTILYQLAELKDWKNNLMTELFKDTEYTSILEIANDIEELQDALLGSTEGEEPTAGIQEQLDAIKIQMAKFDMVQSVVYLPNSENGFKLNTKVLRVKNNGDFKVVAQSANTNTIQFRVSPASKAQDFIGDNAKYRLSFDGQKISKAFSAVEAVGPAELVNKEAGIIEYKVKTSIEDNTSYAVCAVIKGVDSKDDENNTVNADATNLTTTYFVATKTNVDVEKVEIQGLEKFINSADPYKLPYLDGNGNATSVDFAGKIKVVGKGKKTDGSTTLETVVADMVAEYGMPTLEYSLSTSTDGDPSNDKWFEINNGVLTIPNADNTSIGHKVKVAITPNFGAFKTAATNAYVEVIRRNVDYTVAGTKAMAWSKDAKYIPLGEAEMENIVRATNLSTGDFHEKLEADGTPDFTTVVLATGKQILANNSTATDINGENVAKNNTLYIAVPAAYYSETGADLEIELGTPDDGGSVGTDTDIYTIYAKVDATTFPVTKIEKNTVRWSADNTSDFIPQINDTNNDGKIDKVGYIYDASDLIANYATLIGGEDANGYELVIEPAEAVEGVDPVDDERDKFEFTSDYAGDKLTLNVYLKYNTTAGVKKVAEASCAIDVTAMSGEFRPNADADYKIEIKKLSQTYNVAEGAAWVDVQGRTIWEAGKMAPIGPAEGAQFASNPFELYRLEAPTYSIEKATTASGTDVLASAKEWIELSKLSQEGILSFTQKGLQSSYAEEVTITVRISAGSKWGHISGLTPGDSKDYTDVTVVIPKNTTAY